MNTVTASFNATMAHMTKMPQQKKLAVQLRSEQEEYSSERKFQKT